MAKKKSDKRRETAEEREVYNNVVFQSSRVMQGPDDMGFLEISTTNDAFTVVINYSNAEFIIQQLQDFVKGRAPHFARDDN